VSRPPLPDDAKARLRDVAIKAGAVVCGVAAADAFEPHAPAGHRPADLLPGARAVVVVGGAQPRAGDWVAASPWVLESMGTTERIQSVGRRIAQYVEQEWGYYGLLVPPGTESGMNPFVSFTLAAELAGLGSRSLAGPVLSRDHGFLYWSIVVTTAPLAPDPPETEPACPAPPCREMWEREGTTPCLRVCPIDDGGCLGGRLEGGRAVRTEYDRDRCHTRVHTHWIGGFQKVLEEALSEPDREKRKMLLYGDYFTRTLWAVTYSSTNIAQCFECMRVCPAAHGLRPLE
jgi:epoxyqueuosine reductase QueG